MATAEPTDAYLVPPGEGILGKLGFDMEKWCELNVVIPIPRGVLESYYDIVPDLIPTMRDAAARAIKNERARIAADKTNL